VGPGIVRVVEPHPRQKVQDAGADIAVLLPQECNKVSDERTVSIHGGLDAAELFSCARALKSGFIIKDEWARG
jgi:hypothetical protein